MRKRLIRQNVQDLIWKRVLRENKRSNALNLIRAKDMDVLRGKVKQLTIFDFL
ncbi:hypothetical protein K9L67_01420 [Candidatus Woesearchaeota archaeon]|nr:hypothetical protein [Candidatus Woesearchaeota archaeon]MCF7900864.1 hypothetical protein [Candidatus Woesearchaeota archaeon]MCF8014020.1 hypothetical protein [Candidatus Woesearchaeota archaeon]